MVSRMPELREVFLHRRLFLNRRTAALDAALAGAVASLALRRPWPLLSAVPYARGIRRGSGECVVDLAADLVGAWALARGTLSTRAPVL